MSISQNYPTISPSLSLDFANTKKLDPRITYSRASTATYYDGKTVTKAEENLLLQSQAFDNGFWSTFFGSTTVTANSITAPDGTTTADSLTESSSNSIHALRQTFTPVSGALYTVSIYTKNVAGSRFFSFLSNANTSGSWAVFDLSTGTLGSTQNSTSTITLGNDGWYRCTMTFTSNTTASSVLDLRISNVSTAADISYTGDGTSGFYIWGAQLEQRSAVTAYTPTTTQPITNYIPVLLSAPANTARFDHNPVTGESLGLLVEEQRTNLVTYSEDFSNAAWTKSNTTVISNQVIAPDGTLTADLVVATTTGTRRAIAQTTTISGTNTGSFYVKYYNETLLGIRTLTFDGTPEQNTLVFNLQTGVFTVNGTAFNSYTFNATDVGNNWWRVSYSGVGTSGIGLWLINANNGVGGALEATEGQGIYIWGAQLEAGAFPTSYIPTVASQVTRSADSASMTGTNFSSWYRTDQGTLYVEGSTQNNVDAGTGSSTQNVAPLVGLGDGLTNQFRLDRSDSGSRVFQSCFFVRTATQSLLLELPNDSYPPLVSTKIAAAMKAYDYALSSQGLSAVTLSTPDSVIQGPLLIGQSPYASGPNQRLNGTIKKISYYPQRLTNTQLQALTS